MPSARHSVTLREVALAAGVSLATASYALHHDPRIAAATRQLVQATAERLAYRPNPLVTSLMQQRRDSRRAAKLETIAYVSAYPSRARWLAAHPQAIIHRSCAEHAERLGFRVEHFFFDTRQQPKETRLRQILQTRAIRGVIVAPYPEGQDGVLHEDWSRFSLVAIGYTLHSPDPHRVTSDHYNNALLAVGELHKLGYQRIGCVLPNWLAHRVRHTWVAAVHAAGFITPGVQALPPLLPSPEDWKSAAVLAWYRQYRPEVILADHAAAQWLQEALGPAAPLWCSLSIRPDQPVVPCGIHESFAEIGVHAVELVARQLYANETGLPNNPVLTLVPGRWRPPASD